MNRFSLVLIACFISLVCQAGPIESALRALSRVGNLIQSGGSAGVAQYIFKSTQNAEKIEEDMKERAERLDQVLGHKKAYDQVVEERREKIKELRKKIHEERYTLQPSGEKSVAELEAELWALTSKLPKMDFRNEDESQATAVDLELGRPELVEGCDTGFYLVPGLWTAPVVGGSLEPQPESVPAALRADLPPCVRKDVASSYNPGLLGTSNGTDSQASKIRSL